MAAAAPQYPPSSPVPACLRFLPAIGGAARNILGIVPRAGGGAGCAAPWGRGGGANGGARAGPAATGARGSIYRREGSAAACLLYEW